MKRYKGWGVDASVPDLAFDAGISAPTAYKRLDRLYKLGYVDRYRYHGGRAWMYKIKGDDENNNMPQIR